MKKCIYKVVFILLTISIITGNFNSANAQFNGLTGTGATTTLGVNTINNWAASLIYNPFTYVPLWDNNQSQYNGIWWSDNTSSAGPAGLTYSGRSRFRIGDNKYFYEPATNPYIDSKFTVSDTTDYITGTFLSNSIKCHRTLAVEHSNWTFSPNPNAPVPTIPSAGSLFNLSSHIAEGSNCGNTAIYGMIDSSLAALSIGVKGEVIRDGYMTLLQRPHPINIGGEFNVTSNNKQDSINYGINTYAISDRIFGTIPWYNIGINCRAENADTVYGMNIEAYDGTNINRGLYVKSWVDPTNNSSRALDVYGGKFYANNGYLSSTGLLTEVSNNVPNNTNNPVSYIGLTGNVNNNVSSNGADVINHGLEFYVFDNYQSGNSVDNLGGLFGVFQNDGSDRNVGVRIDLASNNSSQNTSQVNIGEEISVGSNSSASQNKGIYINTSGNNTTTPNTSQINYGADIDVSFNTSSLSNDGIFVRVSNNDTTNGNTNQRNTGIRGFVNNNQGAKVNTGAKIRVQYNNDVNTNSNQNNYGIEGFVNYNNNSNYNIGVKGDAQYNDSAYLNVGVKGLAGHAKRSGRFLPGGGNIGVWGWVGSAGGTGIGTGGNSTTTFHDLAGYFSGDVAVNGAIYYSSDSKLKDSLKDMDTTILTKLSKLNPKSYYFKTNDFPGMTLPNGMQFGLVAQDVAQVFPNIVGNFTSPAILDSLENEKYPAVSYQAINYNAFIPLLIQSVKELNGDNKKLKEKNDDLDKRLKEIEDKLDKLSKAIDDCCNKDKGNSDNSNDDGTPKGMGNMNNTEINSTVRIIQDNSLLNGTTELYQNTPNPFKTTTTFTYKLGDGGFTELEITDNIGRLVQKLVNVKQEAGSYTIEWDSSNVNPGMYYYSLKVNSILLVKKAVKLN